MTPFLIAVRHGETDYNARDCLLGQLDPPLNERGKVHADLIAERLAAYPVSRLYSSPLLRARSTAETISRRLNLPMQLDDDLKEVDFGEYDGMEIAELRQRGLYEAMYADRMNFRPPGGETYRELLGRVGSFFDRHTILDQDGLSVIVSHKGTVRMIYAHLGIDESTSVVKQFGHDSMLIACRDSLGAVHVHIEE